MGDVASQVRGKSADGERVFRGLLIAFSGLATAAAVLQIGLSQWSRHALTQVEAIIAVQAQTFADGGGLYTDLNDYPFTISQYGPIFYSLEALLDLIGIPTIQAGRLISVIAWAASIWLIGRITWRATGERYAVWTAALLAAASANPLNWGTLAQSDMPAICFSLAAFERFLAYRDQRSRKTLIWCGVWIAASIYTKQSSIAAGAATSAYLLWREPKIGARFAALLASAGLLIALGLNGVTGGGFFDHALFANLNPFAWIKLTDQLRYFSLTTLGLAALAAAGAAAGWRTLTHPLYLYLGAAVGVFLLTAPKLGSDLNYQVETALVLSACAGLALSELRFFPLLFAGDRGWVTLLQLPLLLHLGLNCAVSGKNALQRFAREQDRRQEYAKLKPYFENRAERVLSVQFDPLVQTRRRIEVQPFTYTLLVNAGLIEPQRVLQDLRATDFQRVLLYQNVFEDDLDALNPEIPRLPKEQLEEIRNNYVLADHVPGPLAGGVYVYERKPGVQAELRRQPESWDSVNAR